MDLNSPLIPPWTRPPDMLALEPGCAHVFRLALDLPESLIPRMEELLSEEERVRAHRFRFDRDRVRFIAAHAQMRLILAAYLQTQPQTPEFGANAYGKPCLQGESTLRFNLSHSGSLGLLAVIPHQEVGVDIEVLRPEVDRKNIAKRFFAPGEATMLFSLPADQQTNAFYACWTRKEAYIKARGRGLSIPLDAFEVSLVPGEPARLLRLDPGAQGTFSMMALEPGPGYAAALVTEGTLQGTRCWDWPIS